MKPKVVHVQLLGRDGPHINERLLAIAARHSASASADNWHYRVPVRSGQHHIPHGGRGWTAL